MEEHELCGYSLVFLSLPPAPPPPPPPPPRHPQLLCRDWLTEAGVIVFWRRTVPVPNRDECEDAGWKTGERSLVYQCLTLHACTPIRPIAILRRDTCLTRLLLSHDLSPAARRGAGIAQWLEHRTRDWKVAGSNPCWNGGRIFFSRVDFLCWLLFRYPFHPRVTTVARKKSRSFCQKCRWQVTAKHAYTLRMWILLNRASALVTTCP